MMILKRVKTKTRMTMMRKRRKRSTTMKRKSTREITIRIATVTPSKWLLKNLMNKSFSRKTAFLTKMMTKNYKKKKMRRKRQLLLPSIR